MILMPETKLRIEHSIGGLLDERDGLIENLIPMMLPIVYNVFYGDVLNMAAFKGSNFHTDNIHGSAVLKILNNSPDIFTEEVRLLIQSGGIQDILATLYSFDLTCEESEFIVKAENVSLDVAEAILRTIPYRSELRQFMHVEGNGLSVDMLDPFTVMVTTHGVMSDYYLEDDYI